MHYSLTFTFSDIPDVVLKGEIFDADALDVSQKLEMCV